MSFSIKVANYRLVISIYLQFIGIWGENTLVTTLN